MIRSGSLRAPTARLRVFALVMVLASTAAAVAQTANRPPVQSSQQPNPPIDPVWFKLTGNYGEWWNALSDEAKGNYIDGYTTAMSRVNSLAAGLCKTSMSETQPGDASFNGKFSGALNFCIIASTFSFKLDKPLKPALDEFYNEPLNARIPIEFAMEHVRDEVAGTKTAGQLLDELNGWRKIGNKDVPSNKR